MSVTLLWASNLTNDGDTFRDGVARSTLTTQVVFVLFLVLFVLPRGLVLAHSTA